MASNEVILGSILGAVVGLMVLLLIIISIYVSCCCVVYVGPDRKRYTMSEVKLGALASSFLYGARLFTTPQPQLAICNDLEQQAETTPPPSISQTMQTNRHRSNTDLTGNIVVDLTQSYSTREELGYRSAAETFERITRGLTNKQSSQRFVKRMSSIQYKKTGSQVKTVVAVPSESKQLYLADQYDSFSRTVMLQNLIQDSVNQEQHTIRDVRDPFLDKLISVGGIVVVIHPFHGAEDHEFRFLQTGDLLRVVKFYIKESEPETILPVKSLLGSLSRLSKRMSSSSEAPFDIKTDDSTFNPHNTEEVFLDKHDPNYGDIYCTGILLSSHLEFINENLSLRLKRSTDTPELELLKDFPLKAVSLETTLLTQLSNDSPGTSNSLTPN